VTLQTSANVLRPATRGGLGVVHPGSLSLASASRAESFALAILARHASTFAGVVPVESVLRARPEADVANVFQMASALALRIQIVNQRLGGRAERQAAPPRLEATPRVVRAARARPPAPSRAIFERVFAREQRIETVFERTPAAETQVPAKVSSPAPPATADWAPPLAMVLRRESPAVASPPGQPPPTHDAPSAPAWARAVTGDRAPLARSAATPASPLTASDLGRITDEVVRTIDQRIVAQRERKGLV
jgi:hypothetical protein